MKKLSSNFSVLSQAVEQLKQHLKVPVYRTSYYLIAGSALTAILGFISLMIATRYFSTESIGLGSAILSSLGLISLLAEMGMGITVIRFLPGAGKDGNDMLNSCFSINMILSTVTSLVFVIGINLWSPALNIIRDNAIYFASFVLFAIITSLYPILNNILLAKRQTQFIVITNLVNGIIKILFIIVFAAIMNNALGFFISTGIATTTGIILLLLWFIPKVQSNFRFSPLLSIKALRGKIQYSISNYFTRIILQMTPFILPMIVINMLGNTSNAYFSVAWSIAAILQIIPSSICNSLFSEATNNESSLENNIRHSIKQLFLLAVPASLIIFFSASIFLRLFGQTYSESGAWLLRMLVLAVIPWGINYLYVSILRTGKDMGKAIILVTLSTGLSMILSYLLIQKIELIGAGAGYLAGQSIAAIYATLCLRKKLIIGMTVRNSGR